MNKTFFRYGCFYHPSTITHSALGGGGVRFQGKLIPITRGVTNYISIRVPIGVDSNILTCAFNVSLGNTNDRDLKLRPNITCVDKTNLNILYTKKPILTKDRQECVVVFQKQHEAETTLEFRVEIEEPFQYEKTYNINVLMSDLRCFEGAFTNPPMSRSIDSSNGEYSMFVEPDLNFNPGLQTRGFPIQKIFVKGLPATAAQGMGTWKRFSLDLSTVYFTYNGQLQTFIAYLWEVPSGQYISAWYRRFLIKCHARRVSASSVQIYSETITEQTDYTINSYNASSYSGYKISYSISHTLGTGSSGTKYVIFYLNGSATTYLPPAYIFIQPLFLEGGEFLTNYPHYENTNKMQFFES